jgi:hypothetical protein
MSEKWEAQVLSFEGLPVMLLILILVFISTYIVYQRMHKPSEEKDWTKEIAKSNVKADSKQSLQLKNIWEERERNGSIETEKIQKTDSDGKPFGSSYYYAHNSLRKTGGYTDGLRLEDFQMETPRLLSKGGLNLRAGQQASVVRGNATKVASSTRGVASSCVPITKYQWDDPGDQKAVGTIRIDQVDANLSWKDAKVQDVKLNLQDQSSLTVTVLIENGKKYRLHIPKLYGRVKEAKKVSKETRLLIRLYKCKNDSSGGADLHSWPTPHKKVP